MARGFDEKRLVQSVSLITDDQHIARFCEVGCSLTSYGLPRRRFHEAGAHRRPLMKNDGA
jgi:hypothetical protein